MNKPIAFHPFLFALFPVLSFYSHNKEQLFTDVLVLPSVISICATAVCLFLLNFLFDRRNKAGILTSIFLLLFFSYGHVSSLLFSDGYLLGTIKIQFVIGGIGIGCNTFLFPVWIALFLLATYVVARTQRDFHDATRVLNVTSLFMFIFPVVSIGSYEFGQKEAASRSRNHTNWDSHLTCDDCASKSGSGFPYKPDIYYIILDRYASSSTLKEFFLYDNSDFDGYLRKKGFFIGAKSRANYQGTFLSLASSLNMDYLDFLPKEVGEASSDRTVVYTMLQNYRVWRFLKARGYKYVHLGDWWEPTRRNEYADYNLGPFSKLNEFQYKLLETTIIGPIRLLLYSPGRRIEHLFESLKSIPEVEGPKYVFAHLLFPHPPFVFDRNGKLLPTRGSDGENRKEKYLGQLIFTNNQILRVVDEILSKSKRPPIVILQSDEGPRAGPKEDLGEINVSYLDALRMQMRILNAYHLPGFDEKALHESLSPVNTFRLIFNHYFRSKFTVLEDSSYVSTDSEHLYKFVDVTDKL